MKDYYEILEVNKKASKEIIDKAYRTLAKKYHPDLQEEEQKEEAKKKMQEINEAYEVLSDDEKRQEYDSKLEELNRVQNEDLEENDDYFEEEYDNEDLREQLKEELEYQRQITREYEEAQQREYRKYLRRLGYKVREKWTWKKFLKLLKILGALILFILILWIFPPTHKLMVETYEENRFIKAIIDVIANVFKGIGQGIGAFFKSIFNKS